MNILEFIRTAMVALRLNMLRSVLTTLGIIIGVASVIVMSAIGSGATKQIEDQIASLGTNQLTIFPGSANVGGRQGGFGSAPPLSEKDVRALREGVTGIAGVSGNLEGNTNVVVGNANWVTRVNGVSAEIQSVRDWPVKTGRFFDAVEASSGPEAGGAGRDGRTRAVWRCRSAGCHGAPQQCAVHGDRRAQREGAGRWPRPGRHRDGAAGHCALAPGGSGQRAGPGGADPGQGRRALRHQRRAAGHRARAARAPAHHRRCAQQLHHPQLRRHSSRPATRRRARWACCWPPPRPSRWWSVASAS